jgi:hypothetical protein
MCNDYANYVPYDEYRRALSEMTTIRQIFMLVANTCLSEGLRLPQSLLLE